MLAPSHTIRFENARHVARLSPDAQASVYQLRRVPLPFLGGGLRPRRVTVTVLEFQYRRPKPRESCPSEYLRRSEDRLCQRYAFNHGLSRTSSNATLAAVRAVLIVDSGTGAKNGEW